jgi:hypothetical protein
VELTADQVRVLDTIATDGPMRLTRLGETTCDELYKMRPRLIKILPGNVIAVVDITSEGLRELARASPLRRALAVVR